MIDIFSELLKYLNTETDWPAYSPGGLFAGLAPEGTTFPFSTWNLISSDRGLAMVGRRWDIPLIQFSLCSEQDSPEEVMGMAEALRFWVEDCEDRFTVAGCKVVLVTLESQNLFPDPDGGWMYQIDFSFDVEAH